MTILRIPTLFAVAAVVAAGLGGCASPAQPTAMIAIPDKTVSRHAGSVALQVTGGSSTTVTSASQIANEDFAAALAESIRRAGLFAQVLNAPGTAAYTLDVAIVRLEQPMFGFSMTATLETNWTLVRRSDGAILWRKAIVSSHTAATGEAIAGVKRLRLATEGAARKNIQEAIEQLGTLTLR